MNFFSGDDTRVYFASFSQKLKAEVDKMSDEEISTCDMQEWSDYLCSKYEIAPIVLFEESIGQSLSETKVKRYTHFYRQISYEPEYFEVDGVQIDFQIPFDGDDKLFTLQPSSRILTRFEVESLHKAYGEKCGNFSLKFDYTKQELQDKGESMLEYVKNQFNNEFLHYKTMIGYVNAEVESYNASLPSFAR